MNQIFASLEYYYSILISLSISTLVLSVSLTLRQYVLKHSYPWLFICAGLLFYAILRIEMLLDFIVKLSRISMNEIGFEAVGFIFSFLMMLGIYFVTTEAPNIGKKQEGP